LTAESTVGRRDADLPSSDLADGYVADDREVMESDAPKRGIRESASTSSGHTFHVVTDKTPMRDAAGSVVGIMGVSLSLD
jgi:hypothetical protein